ncbi:MAG: N-terminal double-transrane protein [Verrucomicrobiaceae bacterium]|nr:N-terminal double-transrane protein [Verrucomicrobiaceae bacterium]
MRFLAPAYLHLLWLALIPLALYLFRRRARRVQVSTLLFFRTLAREHQESAWLRQLKKWLSLALTLLVLLLAVLALARPTRGAAGGTPGAVVFMIDCSASMAALEGRTSRLDEAKKLARGHVLSLPDSVIVSLIAFGNKPSVLLSRSRNRREFLRLLDGLTTSPAEGDTAAALAVAARLAALEHHSQILHAGDEPAAAAEAAAGTPGYEFVDVAMVKAANVGITGFQLRQAPLTRDRYEAFVKISAAAANAGPMAATLEARIGGRIAQIRELELKPGESAPLILPLEGTHGEMLELELKCPGDCLGWDNAVAAPLPELKPLLVAWVADKPDPFTDLALSSLVEAGRLDVLRGGPATWPPKVKPDVYVFENWLPEAWPKDAPVIALSPAFGSGPLQVKALPGNGLPYDGIRSVAAEHPVLYRVNPAHLSLTQTSLIDAAHSLETLWMAGSEPVLAAGEVDGQRIVVTAFSPSKSERLALLPAYPLLLGNALYWCAENSEALADLQARRIGQLISAPGLTRWHAWDGTRFIAADDAAQGPLLEFKRIGAWETAAGRTGSCVLASARETDLRQQAPATAAASAPPGSKASSASTASQSWPQLLLWALLGVLLIESFLFHRKAVY